MTRGHHYLTLHPPQACWNCGRLATETCSGCGVARYCGAFCQHKDWDDHARVCREGNNSGSPDSNSNNTGENNNSNNNKGSGIRPPATTTPTTSEASEA